MGWTSYTIDRNEKTADVLQRELSQDSAQGARTSWEVIDHSMAGSTYYAVIKRTETTGATMYYGMVVLTERRASYSRDTVEFYFKDMTEDMGPHYYDMPACMLNKLDQLSPNPTGYAKTWRESCREHLARKSQKAAQRRQNKKQQLERLAALIPQYFKAA